LKSRGKKQIKNGVEVQVWNKVDETRIFTGISTTKGGESRGFSHKGLILESKQILLRKERKRRTNDLNSGKKEYA